MYLLITGIDLQPFQIDKTQTHKQVLAFKKVSEQLCFVAF